MDLSHPLSVVTPTLDAKVLQGLAATTAWVTGAHVHRLVGTGSVAGVRKVLHRLVAEGVVQADEHSHAILYRLNRDHVAAGAILELVHVRARILDRISQEIVAWTPPVLSASLFGSFARGEADVGSDIDVVIVVQADTDPDDLAASADRLAQQVVQWTGNPAHIVDITRDRLAEMVAATDPLTDSWRADAVHLVGARMLDLMREVRQE